MLKPSVLLDTSFLISFVNKTRDNHDVTLQYYRYMIEQGITMYLSSIVISEFSIKQDITDLPLPRFITLPFNVGDGIEAGKIHNLLGKPVRDEGRDVAKDDLKIMAQAVRAGILFILTDDVKTFYKDCERLKAHGKNIIAIPLKQGFSPSQLRLDGQKDIEDVINQ